MLVKVMAKSDGYWREIIINTDNIVKIWFNELYCVRFSNDEPGLWIDQESYNRIIAAMGGVFGNESSKLSNQVYY